MPQLPKIQSRCASFYHMAGDWYAIPVRNLRASKSPGVPRSREISERSLGHRHYLLCSRDRAMGLGEAANFEFSGEFMAARQPSSGLSERTLLLVVPANEKRELSFSPLPIRLLHPLRFRQPGDLWSPGFDDLDVHLI